MSRFHKCIASMLLFGQPFVAAEVSNFLLSHRLHQACSDCCDAVVESSDPRISKDQGDKILISCLTGLAGFEQTRPIPRENVDKVVQLALWPRVIEAIHELPEKGIPDFGVRTIIDNFISIVCLANQENLHLRAQLSDSFSDINAVYEILTECKLPQLKDFLGMITITSICLLNPKTHCTKEGCLNSTDLAYLLNCLLDAVDDAEKVHLGKVFQIISRSSGGDPIASICQLTGAAISGLDVTAETKVRMQEAFESKVAALSDPLHEDASTENVLDMAELREILESARKIRSKIPPV